MNHSKSKIFFLSILLLQLASACSKSNDNKDISQEEEIINTQAIDTDLKLCVDRAIGLEMDKATQQNENHNSRNPLNLQIVARDYFATAAQSCGLKGIQKDLYLSCTNFFIGVLPDSIEIRKFAKGTSVITKNGNVGTVVSAYENGKVLATINNIGTILFDASELGIKVQRKCGIYEDKKVISKNGTIGTARSVYDSNVAIVSLNGIGTIVMNITEVSPEVQCFENICKKMSVISKEGNLGTVISVFARGAVEAVFNGIGTIVVKASEVFPEKAP